MRARTNPISLSAFCRWRVEPLRAAGDTGQSRAVPAFFLLLLLLGLTCCVLSHVERPGGANFCGRGKSFVGEDSGPLRERQVAGDDDTSVLCLGLAPAPLRHVQKQKDSTEHNVNDQAEHWVPMRDFSFEPREDVANIPKPMTNYRDRDR